MEIQEFQNLPYIKRQKIVKRLYEKKLMSRSALYKTINRGRQLKKEEQLLFDKYLTEVENEVPEVPTEKVVKEKVTPERNPEPEVKKKISIEPKNDVIVDKGSKKVDEGKLIRPKVKEEKIVEEKDSKVKEEIPRAEIEAAIKNDKFKWTKGDYTNAIAQLKDLRSYTSEAWKNYSLAEVKEEFYKYATQKKYFKHISLTDNRFKDLGIKYGVWPKEEKPQEVKEEKVITEDILKEAIKNDKKKWTKKDYVNAIYKMDKKSAWGDQEIIDDDSIKTKEVADEFYELALVPENFKKIKDLTTFRDL